VGGAADVERSLPPEELASVCPRPSQVLAGDSANVSGKFKKKVSYKSAGMPVFFKKQGCQMVHCQTKNPRLGKLCRVLQWKVVVYFMAVWSIVRPFGIFCGHLVYFAAIRYISRFGILHQEKSGNPASDLVPGKRSVSGGQN
jgi:hypothetical protein